MALALGHQPHEKQRFPGLLLALRKGGRRSGQTWLPSPGLSALRRCRLIYLLLSEQAEPDDMQCSAVQGIQEPPWS